MCGLKFWIKKRWRKMTSQEAKTLRQYSSNITSQHIKEAKCYCKMLGNRCSLVKGLIVLLIYLSNNFLCVFRWSSHWRVGGTEYLLEVLLELLEPPSTLLSSPLTCFLKSGRNKAKRYNLYFLKKESLNVLLNTTKSAYLLWIMD